MNAPHMDNRPFDNISDDVRPDLAPVESGNNLLMVFAYIPFLCVIPIMKMGNDEEARFHARQGLVLFLIEIVAAIFLIPSLASLLFRGVLVICLCFALIGIWYALEGRKYRLHVIGEWAEKIKG